MSWLWALAGVYRVVATINDQVQPVLDDLIKRDVERGLQVAAYLDGELVLDAWSGLADANSGRPVDGETLFVAFSCGKGVVAAATHVLADRGQIDYDAPVAAYWPEFGAGGKQAITIRQVLSHTAGVPHLPPGTKPNDLLDWDGICAGIAQLTPLWEPGTRAGYHARTLGFIVGEVIRRVDGPGRSFDACVRAELLQPLGIRDMYFGLPEQLESRTARLEDAPILEWPALPPDSLLPQVFPPNLPPTAALWDQPEMHRACVPSSGGIMNARSLARLYAALACGGELDGVRVMSRERVALATQLQTDEVDAVLGVPVRRALGFFLGDELSPMGSQPGVFGHPGSGGSIGFADPRQRFAFALMKTRLVSLPEPGVDAATLIAEATRAALGLK